MKVLFIILILAEVTLAAMVLSLPFVDRRALADAVAAHHRDPSPEHRTELQVQERATSRIAFGITLSLSVLLVANGCGLVLLGRRLRYGKTAA